GQTINLRFRGYRGSSFTGDMAIDDVSIAEISPIDIAIVDMAKPVEDAAFCYSATENVMVQLTNNGYDSLDFTLDTAIVSVEISGAVNTTLIDTISDNSINAGLLPFLSDISVPMGTVDMSIPGTYYFD